MPIVLSPDDEFYFPPLSQADQDGLLLIGGKVTPQRVLAAYRKGIFPWYNEDEIPLWWSPDPRFVLFPSELHISRSMQKLLKQERYSYRFNSAFEAVILACASVPRTGQDGTWITPEMLKVYVSLHKQGVAHSAEAWCEGELVGGVYGIWVSGVFFGESMFSTRNNASKFAFIKLVQQLQHSGVQLIDCQVYTQHVERLGARLVSRDFFVSLLQKHC